MESPQEDATSCSTQSGGALASSDGVRLVTSLQIRNIPARVTPERLVAAIDALGFAGCYDFLYLPTRIAAEGAEASRKNAGYSFINFKTTEDAAMFALAFHGYRFADGNSPKRCIVAAAHVQGLTENIRNYELSAARRKLRKAPMPVVKLAF